MNAARVDAVDATDYHETGKERMMKPRHPVQEFLRPMGVSQRQFATKLGWTPAKLNELVKRKRGVSAETALDLAKVLGTSPEVWMNLQMTWDLHRAQARRRAS